MSEFQKETNLDIELERKKAEYAGLEYEVENEGTEEEGSAEKPFDADKIRVDQQMLSVKYMLELMEDGMIELNPGYQRRSVWKENKRKSLLIESLMLRIPIPAFYFYENEIGQYQVIDGQQRLTTIREFVSGKFKLTGLEYLGDKYNGKKFENLDVKYSQRIYRTQIAVNILDARSPKKVIYDIFRRVNTGGIYLNPQEMRNAICKQEVRDFLIKSSENENYLLATRKKIKDERMDAQEMALRFYAFYRAYDYQEEEIHYEYPNVAGMLDDAIEDLNEMKMEEREELYRKFDESMKRCYQAFGKYCFSKIQLEDHEIKRKLDYINKSLFTSYSILLMHPRYDRIDLKDYQESLLITLAEALSDHWYANCLTMGTGDKRNVKLNFEYSKGVLKKCLG